MNTHAEKDTAASTARDTRRLNVRELQNIEALDVLLACAATPSRNFAATTWTQVTAAATARNKK